MNFSKYICYMEFITFKEALVPINLSYFNDF